MERVFGHVQFLGMIGDDPPVPTNRVDLDPAVSDVYGFPVARITYLHHPNDLVVAAPDGAAPRCDPRARWARSTGTLVTPPGAATAIPQFAEGGSHRRWKGRVLPDPIGGLVNHQMGTMRMGSDEATSVLDPSQRFWGIPNLYVTDASVFPTSGGYNPTLTVQALAWRAAERILAEQFGALGTRADDDWNGRASTRPPRAGTSRATSWKLNDAEGRRALWLKATILRRLRRAGRRRLGDRVRPRAWTRRGERGRAVGERGVLARRPRHPRRGGRVRARAAAGRAARGRRAHRVGPRVRGRRCAVRAAAASGLRRPRRQLEAREPAPGPALLGPLPGWRRRDRRGDWRGMQGHNWGRRHTHAYGWAIATSGRARATSSSKASRPASSSGRCSRHRSRWYRDTRRRAAPLHAAGEPVRARGRIEARKWQFRAANRPARLAGSFAADTGDFVGLHYENPDGAMTYCLNSKLARGALRLERPGGPPLVATTSAAALEIGTRDPGHGVRMLA